MSRVARLAVLAIRGYQKVIRPAFPPACRFYPSCSEYAATALAEHGLVRGAWLAVRRVARCHPLHQGGYDPPPARQAATGARRGA